VTLSLSKIVPQHRSTVEFTWIHPSWMLFGTFKAARERMKLSKIYQACFWCKKPFEEADMMALAGRPKGANVILCQGCAASANDGEVRS
jgi:hypothetical protein